MFKIQLLVIVTRHLDREFRWGRQPLVRAERKVVRAVIEICAERVFVQHRQVVEIEIAVIGRLPVRPRQGALREQGPAIEFKRLQQIIIAVQIIGNIELGIGIECCPDQTGAFVNWEAGEAEFRLVDRAEILRAGHAHQIAVILVSPTVIAAHQACGIACPFGQRVAAVLAHI